MEIKIKKVFLITFFILFLATLLSFGIYYFLQLRNTNLSTYKINKYPDTINWCNTTEEDNKLNIECKGLLLNIRTLEDSSICFDTQVITKDKEIKALSICEGSNILTYTNEVLGYNKLMPVKISFSYSLSGILNTYSFENILISQIDTSYVDNIINQDISSITDSNSKVKAKSPDTSEATIIGDSDSRYYVGSIKNVYDFCPLPKELPTFIVNAASYISYYNSNILQPSEYADSSFNDSTTYGIKMLFMCDSANKLGYTSICNLTNLNNNNLPNEASSRISVTSSNIAWGTELDALDTSYLKQISLIYDNLYLKNNVDTSTIKNFGSLVTALNIKGDLNEITFCSLYKVYEALAKIDNSFVYDRDFIKNSVFTNFEKITSATCGNIINDMDFDSDGLYLRIYYSNLNNTTDLGVYERCNNLSNVTK